VNAKELPRRLLISVHLARGFYPQGEQNIPAGFGHRYVCGFQISVASVSVTVRTKRASSQDETLVQSCQKYEQAELPDVSAERRLAVSAMLPPEHLYASRCDWA
jgi:hypothetical protein